MALLREIRKNTGETIPFSIDYSNYAPTGVTLDTADIFVFDTAGGDVTVGILSGSDTITGHTLKQYITAGTAGAQYFIQVDANFSDDSVVRHHIPLFIEKALF